jgi:RHS repeat-associated protein
MYSQDGTLLYRETQDGGINYIYLGQRLIAKDGVILENAGEQHFYPYGSSVEGEIDDAGYTGHKFDTDLGLSYMQARYYDPMIGRFYSNDPVDTLGQFANGYVANGFNRYAYANNNPYKYTDPDGQQAERSGRPDQVIGNMFAKAFGFKNIGQANRQLPGKLAEVKLEVSEAAGATSDVLTVAAVGTAAVGQVELAGPLATGAGVMGAIEAALGPDPAKDLAIEALGTVTGAKTVGKVAEIATEVASGSKKAEGLIKAADEAAQHGVSEVVKGGDEDN